MIRASLAHTGGAINNNAGTLTLFESTLSGNNSDVYGGAINNNVGSGMIFTKEFGI